MTKLAAVLVACSLGGVLLGGASAAAGTDWPSFGNSVGAASTGITAANIGKLHRQQVHIDGTVDSAPIYLHGVTIRGAAHDAFFFTTTYGKTEALDATNGKLLWRYTPPAYGSFAGSAQVTVMTPAADPARTAIYAGESDGHIVKLAVATGKLLWSTPITRDPTHEKLAGSLSYSRGLVIAATDGYDGDAPPYQGHVVTLNPANGHIEAVWNSLCSDRHAIIQPSTCSTSDSGIWGRSAPVIDPANGDILVATGNAPYDGKTNWGDSVVVLSPDAKTLLKHWTPVNQADLNAQDLDLGSTAPALINGSYLVQGGKDGKLRLLSLTRMAGADSKTGGELQTVPTPGSSALRSQPVAWLGKWVFVSDDAGTAGWRFSGGRLHAAWSNSFPGTSPVVAGGLLYVQGSTGIHVYIPSSGHEVADLPVGAAHWQSPLVADGRVATGEGNSNDRATTGVFDIFRLG
ncbi:MAG TPA: PQQ-binding-like beta-propeller repeat protein [Gaiellaceae bacterium]|nr:PQQ-binding-like beta-propeller repeat protein [Gaiellaceae bacterium]